MARFGERACRIADGGNVSARDGNDAREPGVAGAVQQLGVADQQVVLGLLSLSAGGYQQGERADGPGQLVHILDHPAWLSEG